MSEDGTVVSKKPRRSGLVADIEYDGGIPKRKITEETCRKWGYGVGTFKREGVQVASYKDLEGNIVAQKIRTASKDFAWTGDHSKVGLYGQWLWRGHGKKVVVTEGELDALSVSEAQDNKWPVVSVPDGASSAAKSISKAIEWLEKYEQVVFMFDMDEPGQKAARECAMLLSPGKAWIASLPLKDASEMLQAGKRAELIQAIWDAKQFRPDGVISGTDLWEKIQQADSKDALPYPWGALNEKTRGCRRGEIVTVTAGTGVGKSEVVRQVASHFHDVHGESVGYIALEESPTRTALGLMGIYLKRRIHLSPNEVPEKDRERAFKATVGSGRYYFFDHWGSLDSDNLLARIRYMVRGCGCSTIILDHVSIVVSGIQTDDERKTIDTLMTSLRSMVQELDVRMIVISHLKRVDGKTHEEGGQISLSHLRGSGSIAQLSDLVMGLERNQQDPREQNITRIRILKDRFTGYTGPAGALKYDPDTGLLSEYEESVDDFKEEPDESTKVMF